MLGRPAARALAAVVVGPDDLVEEARAAEQLVERDLDVVRLAVVEVQVERAAVGQQPAHLDQPRPQEAEVVVEAVARTSACPALGPVAAPVEAGAVAVVVRRPSRSVRRVCVAPVLNGGSA